MKIKQFVPLKHDFMFKEVFGREENLHITTYYLAKYFKIDYEYLKERNLIYLCKIHSGQLESGDNYFDIKETIQINYDMFDVGENARGRSIYELKDEDGKTYSEKIKIHHINIEKCREMCYNNEEGYEEWARLIACQNMQEIREVWEK